MSATTMVDKPDDSSNGPRVIAGEHYTGGLDRDIRAGPDGEPDIGASERGCIVDTVTDHRHLVAARLKFADLVLLVRGQHFGEYLVDAKFGRDSIRHITFCTVVRSISRRQVTKCPARPNIS